MQGARGRLPRFLFSGIVADPALPVAGELLANSRVCAVYYRGVGKSAVLLLETRFDRRPIMPRSSASS
jgi:hypothetical protein